jgi:uncharacterized protein (DUF983 family)
VDGIKCTQCGAGDLEQGFVEDGGEGSKGYARWIPGQLRRGPLGNARKVGMPRWQVDAFRCPQCGHLELFATAQIQAGTSPPVPQ